MDNSTKQSAVSIVAPTMNLRTIRRRVPSLLGTFKDEYINVLQQQWVDNLTGKLEWKDVPFEIEE